MKLQTKSTKELFYGSPHLDMLPKSHLIYLFILVTIQSSTLSLVDFSYVDPTGK